MITAKAVDAGVSAIVVSNHGGRVFDDTPGTALVLPEIAKTVNHQLSRPVLLTFSREWKNISVN